MEYLQVWQRAVETGENHPGLHSKYSADPGEHGGSTLQPPVLYPGAGTADTHCVGELNDSLGITFVAEICLTIFFHQDWHLVGGDVPDLSGKILASRKTAVCARIFEKVKEQVFVLSTFRLLVRPCQRRM